jgi:hypothetical protein
VANGKVLLAHGTIPVPARLERYTDQTITDPAVLAGELAAVRADGYATAAGELEDGLVAVATPVLDGTGACIAALSVSGPEFRMRRESLAGTVGVQREAERGSQPFRHRRREDRQASALVRVIAPGRGLRPGSGPSSACSSGIPRSG